MKEREPDFSRMSRKNRRGRSNKILNILIGVVVVLIVFTAGTIFLGDKDNEKADEEDISLGEENKEKPMDDNNSTQEPQMEQQDDPDDDVESTDEAQVTIGNDNVENAAGDSVNKGQEKKNNSSKNDGKDQSEEDPGTVTYVPSGNDVISETIVKTDWHPVGTEQTGNHVSLYDGESADWNEKKKALAYATGLSEDSMIFWKIKNGGGPQNSVGVVSSKDKSQKYRVHLEWVDGEGWKPVKMDVLNTLDFDY